MKKIKKTMIQLDEDIHRDLLKLKAELYHKSLNETIKYLKYELEKLQGVEK